MVCGDGPQVLGALDLVVARFGDRADGTAGDALAADALREKEAVGVVVSIGPGRGRDLKPGHDRAHAYGLAQARDQAIAEAKGAQP